VPLKINGATIPYPLIVPAIVFTAWLGGLSYQVSANADELEKKADTSERLVKVETTVEYIQKDVAEIKVDQKANAAEQKKQLEEILEAVKK